jgi:hypothetical protein
VQVSAERGKLGFMRSFTAAVCAALAGAFALSGPGEQAGGGRSPKGRAGPRPDVGSADGGSADGGSADGGVARNRRRPGPQVLGDPPGSMRPSPATEAPADAGPPDVSARVDKLEKEMVDLRARAAALEVQLRQAQEQARVVQDLHQQIVDLRSHIAAEAERKAQAEQQQVARREQIESAVSALFSAEQVLARGDPAVGAALDDAEQNLGGQAGRDVAAARLALQNHDLAQARYFLGIAIAHARQGQ